MMRFDVYSLDLKIGLLDGPEGPIHLRPRTFRLLAALIESAPAIVTHQELLERVWQTEHVSTSALTQGISELRAALHDSSSKPRYIETVHRRGYRFKGQLEAMQVDAGSVDTEPGAAHRSDTDTARELLQARQAGETPSQEASQPQTSPPDQLAEASSSRPWLLSPTSIGFGILLLCWLAFQIASRWPSGNREALETPVNERLLVHDFTVSTELPPWFGGALAEMIRLDLAAQYSAEIISGAEMSRIRLEIGQRLPKEPAADQTLAKLLGASHLITGHVQPEGHGIGLVLELPSHLNQSFMGARDGGFLEISRQASAAIGKELELAPSGSDLGETDPDASLAALPLDLHHLEAFFAGLAMLRSFDPAAARDALLPVVKASPTSPLARWALARAYNDLGWEALARSEAAEAKRLSRGLPIRFRLPIEALNAELDEDWATVADLYRALATFFPQDLDYTLEVVRAETRAGRLEKARKRLQDHQASSELGRARLALASARLAGFEAREQARSTEAAAVIARAEQAGYRGIRAEALQQLGLSHAHQGRTEEALAAYQEAAELFSSYGNRWRQGLVRHLAAEALIRVGRLAEATEVVEQAREVLEALGNPQGQVRWRVTLARLHQYRNRHSEAIPLYEEAEALSRESGYRAGLALVLVDRSIAAHHLGQLQPAVEYLAEAGELYRQLGDHRGEATAESNRGTYLLMMGRGHEARSILESALATFRRLGYPAEYNVLENLGKLESRWGDLDRARELLIQALDGYRSVDRRPKEAYGLISLGELDLITGNTVAARQAFAQAIEIFAELSHPVGEARASSRLLMAACLAGDGSQVRRLEEELRLLDLKTLDPWTAATVTEALATAQALSGARQKALKLSRRALEVANGHIPDLEFAELRLRHATRAIADHRYQEARKSIETIASQLREWGHRRGEAEVELLLAHIALFEQRLDDATTHLGRSRGPKADPLPLELRRQLFEIRLHIKRGKREAMASTHDLAEAARTAGMLPLALEVKLLQAQVLATSGRDDHSRTIRSQALEEAAALGIGYLSHPDS